MQHYDYPFEVEWSKEEIVKVISLWNAVERAYESGISKEDFMQAYREFKTVLPSVGRRSPCCWRGSISWPLNWIVWPPVSRPVN